MTHHEGSVELPHTSRIVCFEHLIQASVVYSCSPKTCNSVDWGPNIFCCVCVCVPCDYIILSWVYPLIKPSAAHHPQNPVQDIHILDERMDCDPFIIIH